LILWLVDAPMMPSTWKLGQHLAWKGELGAQFARKALALRGTGLSGMVRPVADP